MIDRRIRVGFFCICIPALLATVASVLVYGRLKANHEAHEPERIKNVYVKEAERLQHDRTCGDPSLKAKLKRRGDWKTLRPGRWGFAENDGKMLVWYSEGHDRLQVSEVPLVEEVSFGDQFLPLVVFLLGLVWFMSFAGAFTFYRSVKERDDFIAATAHDLTTPLVALRRLIRREPEAAVRVSEQMMRLVRNLTDCLAIDSRRPRLQTETFDLRTAYDEAYALFRDDFRFLFGGRDVAVDGPARVDVAADRTKTVQILWNLLANEIKYAAPYGPVRVRFETDESWARVRFVDEGPGLTAAERRKVFRRYYRAKRTSQSGKGGFGIGLATAKFFAFQMGGDLTVAANGSKGCVFTLTLRRAV